MRRAPHLSDISSQPIIPIWSWENIRKTSIEGHFIKYQASTAQNYQNNENQEKTVNENQETLPQTEETEWLNINWIMENKKAICVKISKIQIKSIVYGGFKVCELKLSLLSDLQMARLPL